MIAVNIVARVVGLNPINFIVFYVQAQRASAAAVNGAGAPDHFIFDLSGLLHGSGGCSQGEGQREAARGKRQGSYRRRFNKGTST